MIRGLLSFVVVLVAVIVQITIVARIAFPGGAGPDLVLIAVAALAIANGPLIGSLTGFWGGLALDVAPPGSHFVGQNALVFCLVGYACGLVADAPTTAVPISTGLAVALKVLPAPSFSSRNILAFSKFGLNLKSFSISSSMPGLP